MSCVYKINKILCAYILYKDGKIDELPNLEKGVIKPYYIESFKNYYTQKKDAKNSGIPNNLKNSKWFIFCKIKNALIIRTLLIIDRGDPNYCDCEYIVDDEIIDDYLGKVKTDKSNSFLICDLTTKDDMSKHLHIKFRIGNGTKPSIMIGQMNFIDHEGEIWTLCILAQRHGYNNFNGENPIPIYIEDFFEKLPRTSLTIPKDLIVDVKSLNRWKIKV